MTDGVFPDRLTQLRARWESDPASRIFLQLAEEYRHLGRVQDALAVLDRGLKEHPGYLSALVAKGRCHIELAEGEEARVVLERVVKQDATQMVANKLLVRAYLETGDPVKARERLDLYSLLNDSDPEIEELRRRIRQLERPSPPPETSVEADPFALDPPPAGPEDPTLVLPASAVAPTPPAPARSSEVFDLDLPAPSRHGGDDIFELEAPAPLRPAATAPAPAAFPAEDLFDLEPSPAAASAAAVPQQPDPEPDPEPAEDAGLLFQGLSSRDSRRRYLDALGAEGLFDIEPLRAPAPVPADPAPFAPPPPEARTEEASWLDEAVAAAPEAPSAPAPEPLMPPIFTPEPSVPVLDLDATTADQLWSEEPPPIFEPEPEPKPEAEPELELEPEPEPEAAADGGTEVATATLGELYLRQGHYAEAGRIFREVLQREPASAAARAGLDRLVSLGPQPETPGLDARRLLTGYRRDDSRPADAEARSRKIFLLSRYLDRLRQGRPSDVS